MIAVVGVGVERVGGLVRWGWCVGVEVWVRVAGEGGQGVGFWWQVPRWRQQVGGRQVAVAQGVVVMHHHHY